jgi:MYXO-CTERM domain-containing protein
MTSGFKKALFGGTLAAAGLMGGTAQADFNLQNSYSSVFVYDGFYQYSYSNSFGYAPGGWFIGVNNGFGYAYSYGGNYGLVGYVGAADGFMLCDSFLNSTLNTDLNGVGNINWDFSSGSGFVLVYENGNLVFNSGDFGLSGNENLFFNKNSTYQVYADAQIAFNPDGGFNYLVVAAPVPGPGAVGLLGIAGLVAARRRR